MTSSLALALLLGMSFSIAGRELDPQVTLDRYRKECSGKPAASGACRALREDLEWATAGALRAVLSSGEAVNPRVLRAAAHADLPALRVVALRGFPRMEFTPEDRALVQAALDDPVPAVRAAAKACLWKDRDLMRLGDRSYDAVGKTGFADASRLTPDSVPTEKELGAPVYPGAAYRYFASGRQRALFTTADPPEKVLAFYAQGGKKTLTADELRRGASQQQMDPQAMAAAMKDPAAMKRFMEDLQKMQAMAASGQAVQGPPDLTRNVEGQPGVEGARYVVLEQSSFMGMPYPTRVVVVWNDKVYGKTAIDFPRDAGDPDPHAGLDPGQMQKLQAAKDLLGQIRPAGR